jgi:DNA/RNA endonuclease YhcR with UshA esterase domain
MCPQELVHACITSPLPLTNITSPIHVQIKVIHFNGLFHYFPYTCTIFLRKIKQIKILQQATMLRSLTGQLTSTHQEYQKYKP